VLVELEPTEPPATLLSLAAGVAVIEALAAVPPHYSADLKWPNDVLLDGAKAGGILLERQGSRIVIGFGINLAVAPEVPGRRTASFLPPISVTDFAPILAGAFAGLFQRWRSSTNFDWLTAAWQACATPIGTPLQVHEGSGRMIAGTFAGLEPDGALRLQTDRGIEIVRAGDVEL
jgi:BirA family biotin operon repressor/biotin-[acetyl-CoA-carboxylase] ligase